MPPRKRRASVRERTIARHVVERFWEGGRGYALRIPAYGRRWYVTLGSEVDGWTPDRAIEERDNVLADVRRGIWEPPDRNERPGSETTEPVASEPSAASHAPTFDVFFTTFLNVREGRISDDAYDYEAWAIDLHLRPYFRDERVNEIDARSVDAYTAVKVAESRRRRDAIERGKPMTIRYTARNGRRRDRVLRPLDNSSINKTVEVLVTVLNLAEDYGYVARNVAQGRRRRLVEQDKPAVYVDTVNGLVAMLDGALFLDRDTRSRTFGRLAMIAVLLFAGLRAHELCALKWNDVDLLGAKLHVRKSKTPAGIRIVGLVPLLVRILAGYKQQCEHSGPDDLVFPSQRGTQRDRNNLNNRVVKPVIEVANQLLERRGQRLLSTAISTHKLRHTFASMLVALNTDPERARRMIGHRRYEFTLSAYTHEFASDPRERRRLLTLINS